MEFNILSVITDLAIVFAIVIIVQWLKNGVDKQGAWRWWFVVPVIAGTIAGFATEVLAPSTNLWLIIRSAAIYCAGTITVYHGWKFIKKVLPIA